MQTRELNILGNLFTITAPAVEGAIMTAGEAKTLNQVRGENISNNFRAKVREAQEKGEGMSALMEAVTAYDAAYAFSVSSVRVPVDPVEKETRKVAIEAITGKLQKTGRKYKDWYAEKGEEAAEMTIETIMTREDIIAEAKKRVKARSKAKDLLGDELI